MIIVKTKNGDIFLNESDYSKIEHKTNEHQLIISEYVAGEHQQIDDVETVRFISHAQTADITSTGSEVAKLTKQVELLEKRCTRAFSVSGSFRYLYMQAQNELEIMLDLEKDEDLAIKLEGTFKKIHKILEKADKKIEEGIRPIYKEIDDIDKQLKDVTENRSV